MYIKNENHLGREETEAGDQWTTASIWQRSRIFFDDPHAVYIEDPEHDDAEQRWLVIAKSSEYGLICVVMTFRGDDFRLITARRAERWMVRRYEQQRKRI